MLNILKHALFRSLTSFALIAVLIWLSGWVLSVTMLNDFIGQTYPLYPGLTVTYGNLLLDALPSAFIIGLAAGLLGAFLSLRKWRFGVLAVLYSYGLYVAGSSIAFLFQFEGGATWGPGEAFAHYIWHPVIYPAINITGLLIISLAYRLTRKA